MSFSLEERKKAKETQKVIVSIQVNGQHVKGFPYQQFSRTELVDALTAKSIIEGVAQEFDELAKVEA